MFFVLIQQESYIAGEIFNPKILSGYYYLKKGADAP